MAKINAMMDIGKRAMMNSQTALQTTAHNIANKTTEGFSRQRVEIQAAEPQGVGGLQIGQGTRASAVTRTNNPFLEKQLQKETGNLGTEQGKEYALTQLEQVFNEQMNKGLNQYVTDFFNSVRELSNNPESMTSRAMVKEAATALTHDFQRVDKQLTNLQKDIDERIKTELNEVNQMLKEVARLNEEITSTEMSGISANDQRDRRDVVLKKINERIDISYAEGDHGSVTVSTAGNGILVSAFDAFPLQAVPSGDDNRLKIIYQNESQTAPFDITQRIKGGTIGGILEVRDKNIEDFKDKMDQIAFSLADEVNAAHIQGFDRKGRPGDDFFTGVIDVKGAAKSIQLNSIIAEDVGRIAAAAKPGAVGDNTVANVISQIQNRDIMDDGTSTLDDFYNSQIGRVGVLSQRAIKARESQENILSQLNTIRESISGVSLDEETTNMLNFQKSFDASARVIKTADEMFDTVLNLKRL